MSGGYRFGDVTRGVASGIASSIPNIGGKGGQMAVGITLGLAGNVIGGVVSNVNAATSATVGAVGSVAKAVLRGGFEETVQEKLASILDGDGKLVKDTIEDLASRFPNNLSLQLLNKHLDKVNSLASDDLTGLLEIVKSGIISKDRGQDVRYHPPHGIVGLYAQGAGDYKKYDFIMKEAWLIYNKRAPDSDEKHVNGWELPSDADTTLPGGRTASLRIRTARNFAGVPFMAQMNTENAKKLELDCQAVFEKFSLEGTGADYGVEAFIYTLTKGHPKDGQKVANDGAIPVTYKYVEFRSDEYDELRKRGIFPRAPIDDHHLMSGGIAGGFPDGRCTYELASPDDARRVRVYVNEEDHLCIQGMNKSGTDIEKEFKDFAGVLAKMETCFKDHVSAHFGGASGQYMSNFAFAKNDTMGYLASCPSKNGTGMRISGQLGLPNLILKTASELRVSYNPFYADTPGAGFDKERGLQILESLNNRDELTSNSVQLRGTGGKGTAPFDQCIVDVSYKLSSFVTEASIAQKLIQSVALMYKLEDEADEEEEDEDEEATSADKVPS